MEKILQSGLMLFIWTICAFPETADVQDYFPLGEKIIWTYVSKSKMDGVETIHEKWKAVNNKFIMKQVSTMDLWNIWEYASDASGIYAVKCWNSVKQKNTYYDKMYILKLPLPNGENQWANEATETSEKEYFRSIFAEPVTVMNEQYNDIIMVESTKVISFFGKVKKTNIIQQYYAKGIGMIKSIDILGAITNEVYLSKYEK